MQGTLTEQKVQAEPYHPRLWWMEMLRGGITILFGLLVPFALNLLTAVLGVYLVLDGILDLVKIVRARRATRRTLFNALFGILSIALGLVSLVNPSATLFLIVVVISLRMLFRGVRAIIDARSSRRKYEGATWLFGIAASLFGLVLLVNTLHSALVHARPPSLILVVLFISLYALVDGVYLLTRGLLLRFMPSLFTAHKLQAAQSPADLPLDLPATSRRAVVFVRHQGANGLGHIGWAFEWTNGWFNAGSVENASRKAFVRPQEMGFWSVHTLDPIAAMQRQQGGYDEYKVFYVTHPHPREAWKTVIWESRQPYSAVRHNCNDVAYDVLRAYGASELFDPVEGLVPNDWYDALPGTSQRIAESPALPIHLHRMSGRPLAIREIQLSIPERMHGTPPPWRVDGWRSWQELADTWDKMLRDVHALFVSAGKLVTRRQAT